MVDVSKKVVKAQRTNLSPELNQKLALVNEGTARTILYSLVSSHSTQLLQTLSGICSYYTQCLDT